MARPRALTADPSLLGSLGATLDSGTLGKKLVDILEQAILSGTLKPGERISAESIAKHFGVSRIPVREAFRSLEAEGWIRQEPRQGYYVGDKSETEIVDLFETRLVLEPTAAAMAAERRTGDDLDRMAEIVQRSRQEARAGDVHAQSRSNQQFHAAIATATGNIMFAPLLHLLGKKVRLYTVPADSRRTNSIEEHAALLAAIRRRDVEAARDIGREHVLATRRALDDDLWPSAVPVGDTPAVVAREEAPEEDRAS
jgi:DNA-binding GntR family transcriptional regulator